MHLKDKTIKIKLDWARFRRRDIALVARGTRVHLNQLAYRLKIVWVFSISVLTTDVGERGVDAAVPVVVRVFGNSNVSANVS